MKDFTLDSRLDNDCHLLAEADGFSFLLHRNAEVLWLILVPHTAEHEFYRLTPDLQSRACERISLLSRFLQSHFDIDKINVATIGNVVAQMHIHVIGRRHDDAYWPDLVWGRDFHKTYEKDQVGRIKQQLQAFLQDNPLPKR